MKKVKKIQLIIEKKLGIPGDYQYKALRGNNFLQANWHYNKLQALDILLKFDKGSKVLNLGIGSGNFELEFACKVKKITGVDYNDEALNFVREQLKKSKISNVDLIQTDIRTLNKSSKVGKYDLILLVDVIEHIRIVESRKLIKDLRQLLAKDGKVCVITPNYHSSWQAIEIILDKISIIPKLKGEQHLAKFYKANLKQSFLKQGYEIEFCGSFNLISWLMPLRSLSVALLKLELRFLESRGNLLVSIFTK